jgi:hypothetical protein
MEMISAADYIPAGAAHMSLSSDVKPLAGIRPDRHLQGRSFHMVVVGKAPIRMLYDNRVPQVGSRASVRIEVRAIAIYGITGSQRVREYNQPFRRRKHVSALSGAGQIVCMSMPRAGVRYKIAIAGRGVQESTLSYS